MARRSVILGALALAVAAAAAAALALRERPDPPPLVVLRGDAGPAPAAREGAPDVVVLIGCTVRKDQTTVHGGPANTTPYLAELAAQGAVFGDVIASAPWTKAASTAILTGHDPVSIGMVEPGPGRNERVLQPQVTTLAERLRAAGYHTVGATANPNLNALFGFDQGFDAYVQLDRLWRDDMVKVRADALLGTVEDLLDEAPADRPLYLQLLLVDAHEPFEGTRHPRSAFADPSLPADSAKRVTEYRAALRDFDDAVQHVVTTLEARGHGAEDTLLLVLSDHGEGLGYPEHHGRNHGMYLAPSAVGAVWIARGPGVGEGVRVDGLASQVDVVPTVLGALGLEGYAGPGLDHSGLLAAGGRTERARAWTDTWFISTNRAAVYAEDLACQRDFGRRVSTANKQFREGCFDRRADPLHERAQPSSELEPELVAWRREREAEMRLFGAVDAVLPDDVEAQLEALGYTDGPGDPAKEPKKR